MLLAFLCFILNNKSLMYRLLTEFMTRIRQKLKLAVQITSMKFIIHQNNQHKTCCHTNLYKSLRKLLRGMDDLAKYERICQVGEGTYGLIFSNPGKFIKQKIWNQENMSP